MPNIVVKGKGKETLNKTDFVASGGEGSVYAKKGIAYKLYTDPSKMIPEGKINDLSVLTEPYIIRPLDVIMDAKNTPIGYTMRYVTDTYALVQLFTKSFKQRNNLTGKEIFDLVQKLRKGVQHVHDKGILIVDLNEMNFLVNQKFDEVYFIDVDSYQTPHYRATALMESIRDRHCKNNAFTKETDWFAWGIVTFQMFIGIHPYKGKHPTVNGLDDRMLKNLSVFNKDVTYPAIVEPFDIIPENLRNWYKAVFENGQRICPPAEGVAVVTIITRGDKIIGSNKFDMSEIIDYPSNQIGDIANVIFSFGSRVVQGKRGAMLGSQVDLKVPPDAKIGFTPQLNDCIAASLNRGTVSFYNVTTGKMLDETVTGSAVMPYDGRLYVKGGDCVYEIHYLESRTKMRAMTHRVAMIINNATQVFDGVMIQNLLEATYVSLFPRAGAHYEIRMKELEGYRIVDAKFDRGVLMAVGEKGGKYDRYIFRFDKEFRSYDAAVVQDISHSGLNFVVLDTGICVQIDEEENVIAFVAAKDGKRLPPIDDPAITSDMRLYRWGGQAVVAKGEKLYNFKMKS